MAKVTTWENNWSIFDGNIQGRGGQGTTRIVYRKDDSTRIPYVLKTLNQAKDLERRKRMYREVVSLRLLDHAGIPKVQDTNVENFENLDIPLYFVQDYINGETLDVFIKTSRVSPPEIVKFTMKLLDIVEYCHINEVSHRDIKPDNIMIRDSIIEDPVLIDFGQSFNKESNELSLVTYVGQHIGNRFLVLPEFYSPESYKRDFRSDITVCSGIFFYLLTKIYPTVLVDDKSQAPHRRPDALQLLMSLEGIHIPNLLTLFDQAFDVHIDRRFQTIGALSKAMVRLSIIHSEEPSVEMTDRRIDKIKESLLPSQERQKRSIVKEALESTNKQIDQSLQELLNQIGSEFSRLQGGYSMKIEDLALGNTLGIVHTLSNKLFRPRFNISVVGTEIVTAIEVNGSKKNIIARPLSSPEFSEAEKDILKELYIKGLEGM